MALQSRINEIYPSKKPFMEPADGNKRKAADLRVQAMLGAQEAAKRQCIDGMQQEQMPPAQDFLHPQDSTNQQTATDFSGFFNQLNKEKQQGKHPSSILQQSSQQNLQGPDDNPHQHNQQYAQHQHRRQDDFGLPHLDGLHNQQQQQGRQHSTVPTLDQLLNDHDLGSRHKPPDREIKHMMSLDRVFGADNSRDGFTTASGCNRSNSSATAAAAAAAAAKEQHSWHLTQMPYIPWDWSVKSSVRFSSAQPFNLLEDAQGGRLECLCQAVMAAGGATAGAAASKQERLQQVLMQWQHPAAPLPPALLAAQSSGSTGAVAAAAAVALVAGAAAAAVAGDRSKADGAAVLLRERAQQWREALRGAYVALRHGHCPLVYVCGQAFKQPFTAVLCAPGVMGLSSSSSSSGKFTAVISRTNRLLRAHLATYGCEGLVAGQLEQQAAAAAAGRQQQRQGKQQPAQQQQLSAGAFDGQPGSQLLLVGVQHVHALYAALLALPWCEPGQQDVPLLSAPVPFLHAQLCPLRLVALPDVLLDQQQQQRQADAAGAPLPLHYMELRAPSSIMPWTLHRLLGLLQETQGLEGFQAYFGTEPCSSSLNALPELWTAAAAAAAAAAAGAGGVGGGLGGAQDQQQQWRREGRGFSAAEVESWGGSAVLLHGRTLRQLKQEDGSISAKLA